jgi:hypothetical protein
LVDLQIDRVLGRDKLVAPISGGSSYLVIEDSLKVVQIDTIEFVKPETLKRAAKIEFVPAYGFCAPG